MVKIKPVKRQSLVDTVTERIRQVVTDLGPGERLPTEVDLIKQLQVSRTVLREAIGRLEAMGLVSVQGSRGMFVGDLGSLQNCIRLVRTAMTVSTRELVKFTEFRRAIECEAARCAAETASAKDLQELELFCEQLRLPGLSDMKAFEVDYQFHRKLLEMTGNELMCNVMEVVHEFVMASIMEGAALKRQTELTYIGHQAILAAIRARDADAAERAMREHMNLVMTSLHDLQSKDNDPMPSAG